MNEPDSSNNSQSEIAPPITLRDPAWAALLGWLWPGAGHIYQRRYAKGALFMICVLGTFFYGLSLGDGHVVYAAWRPNDYRWQYFCQLGTGLPAVPAIVQAIKVNRDGTPFFVTREHDPSDINPQIAKDGFEAPLREGPMAPPPGPVYANEADVIALWNDELKHRYDIATIYTVIAGLLNLLAVYDAFAGPALFYDRQSGGKEEDDSTEDDGDSS